MNVKLLLLFALFSVCQPQAVEQPIKVSDESHGVECISNETEFRGEISKPHNNDTNLIDGKNVSHKCRGWSLYVA